MNPSQENNSYYLSAAITWLSLGLRQIAGDDSITPAAIKKAAVDLDQAAALEPTPTLKFLSQSFNLSPLEEGILLLCVAMELDPQIPGLCAQARGNPQCSYPTFALAFRLFANPLWQVISSERPLRYWRLIEIISSGTLPVAQCPLKLDERIFNYLTGSDQLDQRLAALFFTLPHQPLDGLLPPLAPSQQQTVAEICQVLQRVGPIPVVQLLGTSADSKQQVAQQVAAVFGYQLYGLPGELLPISNNEFTEFTRLWSREEKLLNLALFIDTQEITSVTNGMVALRRFLSYTQGLIFLNSQELSIPLNREIVTIEVSNATPTEQREAWNLVLGKVAGDNPTLLTSQFNLNLGEIEQIVTTVSPEETGDSELSAKLWQACLKRTRPRLENLAQRLDTKATWENLVLPDEQIGLLRQIAHQVRQRSRVYDDWGFRARMNRGLGVSAMFAGESGTGKTMAAEVIANDLQLNLYRIDLSAVVSKYIGETEKNLRRLFDAAEEGGAILFFDEADALFGKRSEVKDSHDRYANIEVNYLLQRIESYQGLAILATNLKSSLDQAFVRRLRFIIDFPFPTQEYRQQIWQKVFPQKTPLDKLNYNHLGRLNLTGGTITNIAVNAAFMAAQQGVDVGMTEILAAVKAEYRKLERPIYESEFRWEEEDDDEM
jgi:hypothetical protein